MIKNQICSVIQCAISLTIIIYTYYKILNKLWKNTKNFKQQNIQRNINETLYASSLTAHIYGSKTLITRRTDESRIESSEMECLRSVKLCTKQKCRSNQAIRQELQIHSIHEKIYTYKQKGYSIQVEWNEKDYKKHVAVQPKRNKME